MQSGGVPVVITQDNLNELAVRQAGPSSLNRRGKVIFQDDFSDGLERWLRTAGAGSVAWSSAYALASGFCCALNVTGAAGCEIEQRNPPHHVDEPYAGLEFALLWPAANNLHMRVDFWWVTQGANYNVIMMIQKTGGVDLVINDIRTNVTDLPYMGIEAWHKFKITADFANKRYRNLYINDSLIDVSNYQLTITPTGAPSNVGSLSSRFECSPEVGGATGSVYIGQVIVTVDDD